MSGSITLRELVPIDVAKRLAWTAEFLSGKEAHAAGLVDAISDDPVAFALQHAARMATEGNTSAARVKRGLLHGRRDRFHEGPRADTAVDTTVSAKFVEGGRGKYQLIETVEML